jgi:alpha-tubulin suppressor-like RCC1 family protein
MYRRILILGLFFIISACGGGSYEEPPVVSYTISGVGAIGIPASGKTIYIKDTSGTVNEVTADADGYYSFTAEAQFFPLLIWFDDNGEKVYSVAFGDGTVNVNPLTCALVEFAQYEFSGGGEPENVLYDEEDVAAAEEGLIKVFQALIDLYGVEDYESGFISMADFEANGLELDGIFDDYIIEVVDGKLILTLRGETTPVLEVTSDNIMLGSDSILVTAPMTEIMLKGLLNRISFNTIKGANTSESLVISDLSLIDEVGNGALVSWASSDESVISNTGVLTTPVADELVELVLTISKNNISVSKTFSLTAVGYVTPEELQALEAGKAALTFDVIKGNNISTDRIFSSLTLPTTGASGTDISWSTSSSYISSDGHVNRPNSSLADQQVTLTATISYGSASDTKTFDLTVKSLGSHVVFGGVNWLGVLKSDGTYWSWGDNFYGQLGDGTTDRSYVPVQESTGATDWVQLNTHYRFVSAIKSDGTIWSWGYNFYGQLGDGTTDNSSIPVQESTGATDWVNVSPGRYHTVALKSDGTIWSWGYNANGQLGNGITDDSSIPVQESTRATDWVSISADEFHTVALKSDDTIWSWGYNFHGQLGDGSNDNSNVPVQESTGATDWVSVSTGRFCTVALKSDGTVWSWGYNANGQLGDGTIDNSNVPVQESTRSTDWVSVRPGLYAVMGLKSNGTLWSWGFNANGQLGDGTTDNRSIPVQEATGSTDWIDFASGYFESVAMKSDGTIWTWGDNGFGQLGNGTASAEDVLVPTMIDITY